MRCRRASVDGSSMVQNQKLRCSTSLGRRSTSHARAALRRVVDDVVEPVEEQRHPADAALRHRDLEAGEAHRHLGPQPVGGGGHARSPGTASRRARAARPVSSPRSTRKTRVQAHHRLRLLARREERVPVGRVHRRQLLVGGVLGEAHRLETRAPRCAAPPRPPRPGRSTTGSGSGRCARDTCRPRPRGASRSTPRTQASPSPWSSARRTPCPRSRRAARGSTPTPRCRRGPCRRCARGCPSTPCASRRSGPAPCSSRRRPAHDRVEPDVRVEAALEQPRWRPSSSMTRGAPSTYCAGMRPSNRSGGSMRWSSTEMIVWWRGRGDGSGSSPAIVSPARTARPRSARRCGGCCLARAIAMASASSSVTPGNLASGCG